MSQHTFPLETYVAADSSLHGFIRLLPLVLPCFLTRCLCGSELHLFAPDPPRCPSVFAIELLYLYALEFGGAPDLPV